MSLSVYRLLRNYRTMAPGRFHVFNQRVYKSLKDTTKVSESTWATNPELLPKYFAASEKHDEVYRQASYGSKLDISERDVLVVQLIIYLDEIALLMETAALRTPDILLCSGFDLAKERRSSSRAKAAIIASTVSSAEQQEQQ